MIKRILWTIAFIATLAIGPAAALPVAYADTISVPGDYATIQDAINAANPGDTIVVAPGTYTIDEQLLIGKPITLRGHSKEDTLLQFDASLTTAIRVQADDVTIEKIHLHSQASATSGDTYVIDIPFKAWGPDPSMPEEFYASFALRDAIVEGARRSLWIHAENVNIENTEFRYDGNRQAIQFRALQGVTRIVDNTFSGGAQSRAAIIFEAGGPSWPLVGDITLSGNTVVRFTQFALLNMGSMTTPTDLAITDNVICHEDRSGSSIIFSAPANFAGYDSILIKGNTIINNNSERLAVYVDYSYGGSSAAEPGQINIHDNYWFVAQLWGKTGDTVHSDAPVGFSAGAPAGMTLDAFYLQNNLALLEAPPCGPYVPEPEIIEVQIDIKPGSDPNSINPRSRGVIPVAILSAEDFDAPALVDLETLTFGSTGAEESLAYRGRPGAQVPQCAIEDVNNDGLLDLVCHFETQKTGFQSGDTEGVLKGETFDGDAFEGRDSVRIVP